MEVPGMMRLLNNDLRQQLQESVSKHINRRWSVRYSKDMSVYACHPCAILSDGVFDVFAKLSCEPNAKEHFDIERLSLEYLSSRADVRVSTPIGVISSANGTLFVMEALNPIERDQQRWREIGQALARIHRVKSDHCGFHMHNYFGPLEQDNTPVKDWATFYGEYRLRPRLKAAVDSGNLPSSVAARVETIIKRLPQLCGPEVTPRLLHGDAQQNNFVSTMESVYVIDPAIYYGNPELDLAYVDYLQPVPKDVFEAYQEEMPIDPGFAERRSLWRISGYLAGVAAEGSYYVPMLANAVQEYT